MTAERILGTVAAFVAAAVGLFFVNELLGALLLGLALGGWIHGVAAACWWAGRSAAEREEHRRSGGFGSARYMAVVAVAFFFFGLLLVRASFWNGLGDWGEGWCALTGASLVVSGWLHGCLAAVLRADSSSRPTETGLAHASLASTLLVLFAGVAGPILSGIALAYAFGVEPGAQWD